MLQGTRRPGAEGHRGTEGNKKVDKYAKSPMKKEQITMDGTYSKAGGKSIVKSGMKRKWQKL